MTCFLVSFMQRFTSSPKKRHLKEVPRTSRTTMSTPESAKSLQKKRRALSPNLHHLTSSFPLFLIPGAVCCCCLLVCSFFWIEMGDAQQISLSCPAHCSWVAAPWLLGGLKRARAHPGPKVSLLLPVLQFSRQAARATRADHTGCCKHCHSRRRHSCNTLDSQAWGVAGINSHFILRPYLNKTFTHKEVCAYARCWPAKQHIGDLSNQTFT